MTPSKKPERERAAKPVRASGLLYRFLLGEKEENGPELELKNSASIVCR
jgi:hypothetical protein